MFHFEDALSSYVKDRMQRQYPEERPARAASLDEGDVGAGKVSELEKEVAELSERIQKLQSLKNKEEWTGESVRVMGLAKKRAEAKLRKMAANVQKEQPVVERYIRECR
jgi:hypothetical protein